MIATLSLMSCVLATAQPADHSEWLLLPQLGRAQEFVYRGTYEEKAAGTDLEYERKYSLRAVTFVLDAGPRGTEAAFLTVLRPRNGRAARPEEVVAPSSARLEVVRVDAQGRLTGDPGVSLLAPLEGPPTVEVGSLVEVPKTGRRHRQGLGRRGGRPAAAQAGSSPAPARSTAPPASSWSACSSPTTGTSRAPTASPGGARTPSGSPRASASPSRSSASSSGASRPTSSPTTRRARLRAGDAQRVPPADLRRRPPRGRADARLRRGRRPAAGRPREERRAASTPCSAASSTTPTTTPWRWRSTASRCNTCSAAWRRRGAARRRRPSPRWSRPPPRRSPASASRSPNSSPPTTPATTAAGCAASRASRC